MPHIIAPRLPALDVIPVELDRTAARAFLLKSYITAVGAADPLKIIADFLSPPHADGKTLVVGAGRAVASMALAAEQAYAGRAKIEGLITTHCAHGLPTEHIRIIEAGYPVPDEAGEQAVQGILDRVCMLTGRDRLIVLVSGGGSSLLSLPAEGTPMGDLKDTTHELLRCGAPIIDMNIVHEYSSRIQGGRLTIASRVSTTTLVASDVAGDNPGAIVSGPTMPDASIYVDALVVIKRWGAQIPDTMRTYLERGAHGEIAGAPRPGDACFVRVTDHVIATTQQNLQVGAQVFATRGIHTVIFDDTVIDEAREVAQIYGALARQVRQYGASFMTPVALISGDERTVTIPPGMTGGHGGRCTELLLSLGVMLEDMGDIYALAADTDGIDRSEGNAGALLGPGSIARAAAKDVAAHAALGTHDAYGLFATTDDLIVADPTRTNINDYHVALIPRFAFLLTTSAHTMTNTLTIVRPDDWHLRPHDGDAFADVVGDTARQSGRAIIMPNLKPPVITTAQARVYREHILTALPAGTQFEPLMTLYLTDSTSSEVIREARANGFIYGMKLYLAGVTTNSDTGITDLRRYVKTLEAMREIGMPLLVRDEATDLTVDIFDREAVFIDTVMLPLRRDFPAPRVMFEHIATKHAAEYVRDAKGPVGTTITAHHLLYNHDVLFVGGIRPHYYRLPVLKRETYRLALVAAATSGRPCFFLGTDNAPHAEGVKEHACDCAGCCTALHAMKLYAEAFGDVNTFDKLESFASLHGPDFYGLPHNAGTLMLAHSQWQLPVEVPLGEQTLVPLRGGEMLRWESV